MKQPLDVEIIRFDYAHARLTFLLIVLGNDDDGWWLWKTPPPPPSLPRTVQHIVLNALARTRTQIGSTLYLKF